MEGFSVGIITVSDKGSKGERADASGPAIEEIMKQIGGHIEKYVIVPDEKRDIKEAIIDMSDMLGLNLILTTGGTGFSKRDVTPEATLEVIERYVPGIPEAMRAKSLQVTPKAMLSRAQAGIRKQSLIINLPGSPKAASECLTFILGALPHALSKLKGDLSDCEQP